jgi:hypothetical protein
VERWNGTSWQQQAVSTLEASFADVSCPAAQLCVAVGDIASGSRATLAEMWNGTSWTVQPTPPTGQQAALSSVSCPTPTDCVAVGDFISPGPESVFIERWNGTSWAIQKSPQLPRGDHHPELGSVSCATASSCTAMGGYFTSSAQLLVEHWNGTSWVRQHVPGAASNRLFQVSCPSATSCTAIGGTVSGHWNGTAWALQRTTRPPHTLGGQVLYAVSCPTVSVCEAAGFFHTKTKTGGFRDRTLIEAN